MHELLAPFCHQLPARALSFGEPLPVCARCTGLYLGLLVVVGWLAGRAWLGRRPWAPRWLGWAWGVGLSACALDGLLGASYRLGWPNESRFVLGFAAGMGLAGLGSWPTWRRFRELRAGSYRDRGPWHLWLAAAALATSVLTLRVAWFGGLVVALVLLGIAVFHLAGLVAGSWLGVRGMRKMGIDPRLGLGVMVVAAGGALLVGCGPADIKEAAEDGRKEAEALEKKVSPPSWAWTTGKPDNELRVIATPDAVHFDASRLVSHWLATDAERLKDREFAAMPVGGPRPVAGGGVKIDPRATTLSKGVCSMPLLADEARTWRSLVSAWHYRMGSSLPYAAPPSYGSSSSSGPTALVLADAKLPWFQTAQIVRSFESSYQVLLSGYNGGSLGQIVFPLSVQDESKSVRQQAMRGEGTYGGSVTLTFTASGVWVTSGTSAYTSSCDYPVSRYGGSYGRYGGSGAGYPQSPTVAGGGQAVPLADLRRCLTSISSRSSSRSEIAFRFADGMSTAEVVQAIAAAHNDGGTPMFSRGRVLVPSCDYTESARIGRYERRASSHAVRSSINPFLFTPVYPVWAGVMLVVGFVYVRTRRKGWEEELSVVRREILGRLGLAPHEGSHAEASRRILALVPAKPVSMVGPLYQLSGAKRIWLCFLDDGMLAVASDGSATVGLSRGQMRKLCLGSTAGGSAELGIELEGGMSELAVERMDDLVRIVNVLAKQGIVLRYLRKQV